MSEVQQIKENVLLAENSVMQLSEIHEALDPVVSGAFEPTMDRDH